MPVRFWAYAVDYKVNIICIAVIPATARVIQNKLFCQFVALDTSIEFPRR